MDTRCALCALRARKAAMDGRDGDKGRGDGHEKSPGSRKGFGGLSAMMDME